MNKRTFALLICLVLIFGLLPVTAYAAATIDQVDIMITHPVHLGEPDFYVQVYGTGCKLDTDVDTDGHQDGVRWRKIATGAIVTSGMTFTGGELYELSVCLVADDGYAFSADQTKITVNLDEASFTLEDARHIRMTIQLTADNLYVNYVTVTGLDAPRAGNTADHSVTVQENTCQLTSSGYDTCKNGVTWYDATDSAYCPVGATFQGGHEYWAEIHLRANPGYAFPYDAQGYVDGTWIEAGGSGEVIVLVVPFAPLQNHTPSGWRTTQVYHYKVCTTCGEMLEQEDHKGGTATCAEKGKCAVCGYEYIETNENHTPDLSKWIARGERYHYHACKDCGAHCDIGDHVPGPAATETTPQTCKDCGYIIAPAKDHVHDLSKVPQVPATCTQGGNMEYYVCTGCMDCFTDPGGKNRIPESMSVLTDPLGHTASDDWAFDDDYHWRICTVCGEVLEETKMVHDMKDGECTSCGRGGEAATAAGLKKPQGPEKDTDGEMDFGWIIIVVVAVLGLAGGAAAVLLAAKYRKKQEG